MAHIVLLGDSIFDNARYVPDRPPVIEQLRRCLPSDWKATLLAVDGDVTEDVANQLTELPADATQLFVSVGGNDALSEIGVLGEAACSVGEALEIVGAAHTRFRNAYRAMLQSLSAIGKPTTLCTIYDAVPGLEAVARTALAGFNDVILRGAILARLPVIDLRIVCCNADDYSPLSSIEPSVIGGAKIARVIADVATKHDFGRQQCVVYS